MMLTAAILGSLIFMGAWSLAWRSRPYLAFGMFLGVAAAAALVALVWFTGIRHLPIWLPALPVALVATTLFTFGVLAWRWGRDA
jgi:hypothetical protein